jgi:hypothetical protein
MNKKTAKRKPKESLTEEEDEPRKSKAESLYLRRRSMFKK